MDRYLEILSNSKYKREQKNNIKNIEENIDAHLEVITLLVTTIKKLDDKTKQLEERVAELEEQAQISQDLFSHIATNY